MIKLQSTKTKLIISTGDTSDIDGFLALAEYSKVCYSHSIVQKIHFHRYRSTSVGIMSEQIKMRSQYISDHNIFPLKYCLVQTGADVLFIMNYPAYVGVEEDDDEYHIRHPGLGFKYGSTKVKLLKFWDRIMKQTHLI